MNILDLPITPAIIEYYYMYSTDYLAETIDELDDYLSPELKAIEDWDDRNDALCKFIDEIIYDLSCKCRCSIAKGSCNGSITI